MCKQGAGALRILKVKVRCLHGGKLSALDTKGHQGLGGLGLQDCFPLRSDKACVGYPRESLGAGRE